MCIEYVMYAQHAITARPGWRTYNNTHVKIVVVAFISFFICVSAFRCHRKEETLKQGVKKFTGEETAKDGNVKILTNCPACQQGLSRYADTTGMDTDYIVVEMCKNMKGEKWSEEFVEKVTKGGIEKVLL